MAKPREYKGKHRYPFVFNPYPWWFHYDEWNPEITALKSTAFNALRYLCALNWKYKKNPFHLSHKEMAKQLHLKDPETLRIPFKQLKESGIIGYERGVWEGRESVVTINWGKIAELYDKVKDKILVRNGGIKQGKEKQEQRKNPCSPHRKTPKKQQEQRKNPCSHTGKQEKEGNNAAKSNGKTPHSKKSLKKSINKSMTGLENDPRSRLFVKPLEELNDYFRGLLQTDEFSKRDRKLLSDIVKAAIPFWVIKTAVDNVLAKTKQTEIGSVRYFRKAIFQADREITHTLMPEPELMTEEQKEQRKKFDDLIQGVAKEKAF